MNIYDELALVADTKENLRLSLGLSKDVPFSQYASRIPFYLKAGNVFDFVNNQYSKDQLPVDLSDISEFIRLSSATEWQGEQIVEVADNVPRISGEGLLIEPQRTNTARPFTTWSAAAGAVVDTRSAETYPYTNLVRQSGAVYTSTTTSPTIRSLYIQSTEGGEAWLQSSGIPYDKYTLSPSQNRRYKTPSQLTAAWGAFAPLGLNTLRYPQSEEGEQVTSYIPVGASPTTRSPDILNIPIEPNQTITGDWDSGVTYSVDGGIATFEGHGYIRNITVEAL